MTDISALRDWLALIALIISVGTSFTIFFTSGSKKNAATITEHETRISKLEGEMAHLPRTEAVHKQQLDITEMKGTVAVLAKSMEATERTTRRVEEYLLSHKDAR